MGILPSVKELRNFGNEHPFLSLFAVFFAGMTAVETMQSFTAPKGQGPWSWKRKVGLLGLGERPKPHFHEFSEPVQQHWGKHPGGTTEGSRGYNHTHLGATTSTSTTTSSSHPAVVRETMEEQANRYHVGDVSNIFGVSTTTSTSSAHPPSIRDAMTANNLAVVDDESAGQLGIAAHPALRRRLSAGRMTPSRLGASHTGKQTISEDDEREQIANDGLSTIFNMAGVLPEMGGSWTE